jgi:hypothetical protein
MPLSESFNGRLHVSCWTRSSSLGAACPRFPETWRRDYDTDSGLALADATSLRRKLAWSERAMGQGALAIWGVALVPLRRMLKSHPISQ